MTGKADVDRVKDNEDSLSELERQLIKRLEEEDQAAGLERQNEEEDFDEVLLRALKNAKKETPSANFWKR